MMNGKKCARSSAGKKMLNVCAAKNVRAPAQASKKRLAHLHNVGKKC
jgi:hypothetical protein